MTTAFTARFDRRIVVAVALLLAALFAVTAIGMNSASAASNTRIYKQSKHYATVTAQRTETNRIVVTIEPLRGQKIQYASFADLRNKNVASWGAIHYSPSGANRDAVTAYFVPLKANTTDYDKSKTDPSGTLRFSYYVKAGNSTYYDKVAVTVKNGVPTAISFTH